jgi:hypothetical protein
MWMSSWKRATRTSFVAERSFADRRRTFWYLRRSSWRRDHYLQWRSMLCWAGMTRVERQQSWEAIARQLLLCRRVSCLRGAAAGFVQRGRTGIHCDALARSGCLHVTIAWAWVSAHGKVSSSEYGHGSRVAASGGGGGGRSVVGGALGLRRCDEAAVTMSRYGGSPKKETAEIWWVVLGGGKMGGGARPGQMCGRAGLAASLQEEEAGSLARSVVWMMHGQLEPKVLAAAQSRLIGRLHHQRWSTSLLH